LSGDATTSSDRGRFRLQGQLAVDEGRIELVGGDAPKLPADVIVKGAQEPGAVSTARDGQPLMIEADLKLALGDKLYVHGSGLDARLAGELALSGALPDAPRARGTVQVRDGTFSAYGRELKITRGRVIFNGPLDNPVLDIVALRLEQAVEAGVTVSGTVLSPKIRLTSSPDVPDAEKLSWLVLGQGLEGAQGAAQIAALQAAASTLFGSNDGSMSAGLRNSLGLDVLTVRGADSGGSGLTPRGFGESDPFPGQLGQSARAPAGAAGSASDNVVAVGKRLGSKLLLSYEQGLQGTWSLLRLQYDLTRRLSLRAQTGTQTALDILMRYPFD
jgi:translocation and assembly module TamB